MFKRFFPHAAASLLLACAALPAQANWYLDGESSRLSFISSKNGNVSEVQRFLVLHGQVQPEGLARLEVELESISGGIPLRDERMRAELFEIKQFAEATVTAKIDLAPIQDLANGAQLELRLPLTVNLHGKQHDYPVELLATRLDERRFQVVTLEPVVLNAADFDLVPGLEKLRNLAGLSAIGLSVPVNAVLIFTAR
ncbi:YceI family protein [Pseudomonas sp. EA_15y_Pfl2_R67]|uniref:YceI family protein n=1 Tax=Pseudomonas sp. EA_15y_Pfl2_R67 TaxID=3088687 RepID=UPI0030D75641